VTFSGLSHGVVPISGVRLASAPTT
jgi:hypothetical protein